MEERLKKIMGDIYADAPPQRLRSTAQLYLIAGNDIAAFKKISQAMIAQVCESSSCL